MPPKSWGLAPGGPELGAVFVLGAVVVATILCLTKFEVEKNSNGLKCHFIRLEVKENTKRD